MAEATMAMHKLMWMAQYMPCHDHNLPDRNGPYTENDWWTLLGLRNGSGMVTMQSEIRTGPYVTG